MNRVNIFPIHRCINEGYGLIQMFTEKNTDFPHEIVACLTMSLCNVNLHRTLLHLSELAHINFKHRNQVPRQHLTDLYNIMSHNINIHARI